MSRKSLTLEQCYELGIYVFAGQHKLSAILTLKAQYPANPLYSTYELGYITAFDEASVQALHHLKVVGNLANDITNVRLERGWLRDLLHVRDRYTLDKNVLSNLARVNIFIFMCVRCNSIK